MKRKFKGILLTLVLTLAMSTMAFAADGAETAVDISTALQDALNTVVVDFMEYVAIVLPIGLTIFGTVFGVRKGMQFFKTVSK